MKYFVSYMFVTTDGSSGFGYKVATMKNALDSAEQIEVLNKAITEANPHFSTVVLLFFKEIGDRA